MNPSKKVVLTGATGFVGKGLCRELLLQGWDVQVLVRNVEKARNQLPYPVKIAKWDPLREELDSSVFQGVDAVIHLAGESIAEGRWTEERKRSILDSRILSTRLLWKKMKEGGLPRVFVSASAVGYYGDRGDELLDEKSAPESGRVGFLSEVCQAWENEIFQRDQSSVRQVAIRTGVVLERDGGALAKLLPLFSSGLGGPIGGGLQWMSWIHRQDLIRIFIEALQNETIQGAVNGVAPQAVTQKDFSSVLGSVLHRPSFTPTPAFALKVALGEMSTVILSSQRVRSAVLDVLGFQFEFPQLQGALEAICAPEGDPRDLVFEAEQWVPKSREEIFPFFSDAGNLEKLTPALLEFSIQKVSTDEVQTGTLIDYRLKVHGVPLHWKTRIEEWTPPIQFVDHQLNGPYKKWRHTHRFIPMKEGTLMMDRVLYQLPMGGVGKLAAGAFVRKDVEEIFKYRRKVISELFGAFLGIWAVLVLMSPFSSASTGPIDDLSQKMAQIQKLPRTAENCVEEARAHFFLGHFAQQESEKLQHFEKGFSAAELARTLNAQSPAALLWWASNLGARAEVNKSLSALFDVKKVEKAFLELRDLDPAFEFGAADRALGQLYRKAPKLISVGSNEKARFHLQQAMKISSEFPANRLFLAEYLLEEGEVAQAQSLASSTVTTNWLDRYPIDAQEWERLKVAITARASELRNR